MSFSIPQIAPLILEPLRYFFVSAGRGANLYWDPDETKRTLDIRESFDMNKPGIEEIPRIIVTRGGFQASKTGVSSDLAESATFQDRKGDVDQSRFIIYSGTAGITIESRNKGSCEFLTDMVVHFLVWTRAELCSSQGWKEFAVPIQVSDCNMTMDETPNVPKFQVQISIPWVREELWNVKTISPLLKKVALSTES